MKREDQRCNEWMQGSLDATADRLKPIVDDFGNQILHSNLRLRNAISPFAEAYQKGYEGKSLGKDPLDQ